jgi:hypothetical protein
MAIYYKQVMVSNFLDSFKDYARIRIIPLPIGLKE